MSNPVQKKSDGRTDRTGVSRLKIKTSWGDIFVDVKSGKVTSCQLPQTSDSCSRPLEIKNSSISNSLAENRSVIKKAEAFVRDILSGQSVKPPPVTFPEGTPVQNEVWRVLHAIPFGKVMTYGEVARKIGRPRAARSVGQACGANLIPLIIPCHRVVGSGGALGGFSGGLAWKKQLLQMEKWQSRSASVRRTAR